MFPRARKAAYAWVVGITGTGKSESSAVLVTVTGHGAGGARPHFCIYFNLTSTVDATDAHIRPMHVSRYGNGNFSEPRMCLLSRMIAGPATVTAIRGSLAR